MERVQAAVLHQPSSPSSKLAAASRRGYVPEALLTAVEACELSL
jgi:hypothetical protein